MLVCLRAAAATAAICVSIPAFAQSASWSGPYIGAHIGGASVSQSSNAFETPSPGFGAPGIGGGGIPGVGQTPSTHDLGDSDFIGGGHAGYNWQFGTIVAGLEGDITSLRSSRSSTAGTHPTFAAGISDTFLITNEAKSDWLASVRARIGLAVSSSALVYATGGVAFTHARYASSAVPTARGIAGIYGNGGSASESGLEVGFVAGGGLEWKLTQNWVVRGEYLYYGFGGKDLSYANVNPVNCTPANCVFNAHFDDLHIHTGRLGLSYKF